MKPGLKIEWLTRNYSWLAALVVLNLAALACGITLNLTPEPPTPTSIPTLDVTKQLAPQVIALISIPFEETSETPPYRITAQIPSLQIILGIYQRVVHTRMYV
jgi:hypothetical protein